MKTLDGRNKEKAKYLKQAKRWFLRNPNRKQVQMTINSGTISITREEVVK